MKKFSVLISETALRQLQRFDQKVQQRIKVHLRELAKDPFRSRPKANIKKLVGSRKPELYRLRIGSFRAIYAIIDNEVKVTEIILRSKGYAWLD